MYFLSFDFQDLDSSSSQAAFGFIGGRSLFIPAVMTCFSFLFGRKLDSSTLRSDQLDNGKSLQLLINVYLMPLSIGTCSVFVLKISSALVCGWLINTDM